jgi:hypothetical protein
MRDLFGYPDIGSIIETRSFKKIIGIGTSSIAIYPGLHL